jgi:hypothetical protein
MKSLIAVFGTEHLTLEEMEVGIGEVNKLLSTRHAVPEPHIDIGSRLTSLIFRMDSREIARSSSLCV